MRRRPTRVAAAFVACGTGLILLAGPAQASWLVVLGALVLGVVLGSLPVRHRLHEAVVEVAGAERARVGDAVTFRVRVHAPRHPLPVLRLELQGPPYGDVPLLIERIAGGSGAELAVTAVATRRGRFETQPVRLLTGAPFGLLRSTAVLAAACRVDVGAAIVPVPTHVLRSITGSADDASERRRGVGDEVHAVREFRSGDALRHVHWRSTARVGRLVVREYERPVPTRTTVAVAGSGPVDAFEALVSAAASVAHAVWRAGEPVDALRVVPGGGVDVVRGASQHGLLAWSAAIEPGPADLREVARVATDEAAPSYAVLALGHEAAHVGEACALLAAAGCEVTVIELPGAGAGLPPSVRRRVLQPDVELVAALAERSPA
ncbi:MAG TPA: DUF58 domain-containing protein [Mycobacteriales bacterium]|nr:DUF58 domain-containing protein [Mycobacteriales bacterium]